MRSALIAASTASDGKVPRLAGALLRTQPDARLARLAGEGSEAAFEEIVRRYRPALVSFAAKISSRDSADDVVQDSIVKAHAALLRGDRPDAPRAWLFRIVRNTALNERRDRRTHLELDESFDGVEQPPDAIDRRRRLRDLVAAMRQLPRAQREALVQRELEGKGHEEIAATLEISPGAVRQLIFRARATLRAGLGALLPMQLLRAAVLSGATDQAGAGAAAGAGAGAAAKLGIGAVITTGALFAGATAVKHGHDQAQPGTHKAAVAAKASDDAVASPRRAATAESRTAHRRTVVVRPKASAPRMTASAPSRPAVRQPAPHQGPANVRSDPPPPTTGPTGGGGSTAPSGGSDSTQTQPTVQERSADCPDGGSRDPGGGGVSPP
jgi:RNA polymerase sigma factor (sigma-70 family)